MTGYRGAQTGKWPRKGIALCTHFKAIIQSDTAWDGKHPGQSLYCASPIELRGALTMFSTKHSPHHHHHQRRRLAEATWSSTILLITKRSADHVAQHEPSLWKEATHEADVCTCKAAQVMPLILKEDASADVA